MGVVVYYTMFIIPAIFALNTSRYRKNITVFTFGLLYFIYLFIIGLRYEIGADWFNYLRIYEFYGSLNFSELLHFLFTYDPLYVLINFLGGETGGGIYLVNTIAGVIFLYGITKFSLNQRYPFLSFMIGVPYLIIVVGMGYTRQAMAIGFILLVYNALIQSKYLKAVFLNVLAVLSHKTAVIIFPFVIFHYLLSKKISLKWALSFFMMVLFSFFIAYIFFLPYYEYFLHDYIYSNMRSMGGFIRLIMNLIPAIIYILIISKLRESIQEKRLWFMISVAIISLIPIQIMGFSTVADRIGLYFTPIQMVSYGKLLALLKGKYSKIIFILLLIIGYLLALFVFLNYADHRDSWVPYKNILWID